VYDEDITRFPALLSYLELSMLIDIVSERSDCHIALFSIY
jgi:hypothetical protein